MKIDFEPINFEPIKQSNKIDFEPISFEPLKKERKQEPINFEPIKLDINRALSVADILAPGNQDEQAIADLMNPRPITTEQQAGFDVASSQPSYKQAGELRTEGENDPTYPSVAANMAFMATQEITKQIVDPMLWIGGEVANKAIIMPVLEFTAKRLPAMLTKYLTKDIIEPIVTKTGALGKYDPVRVRDIMTRARGVGAPLIPEEQAFFNQIKNLSKDSMKKAWEEGVITGKVERPVYQQTRELLDKNFGIKLTEYNELVMKPPVVSGSQLALPEKTGMPAEPLKPEVKIPEITQEHRVIGIDSDSGLPIIKMTPKASETPNISIKPNIETIKPIIEEAGGKFVGIQKEAGYPDIVLFNEPLGNSTMAIPMNEVTPETVASKIQDYKNKIEKITKSKLAPSLKYKSDIAQAIKESGGISRYTPDLAGKEALKEEIMQIPRELRGSKKLDEVAQELYDRNVISEPTENELLSRIEQYKLNKKTMAEQPVEVLTGQKPVEPARIEGMDEQKTHKTEIEPLEQEALKYKTPDEFVKNNTKDYYQHIARQGTDIEKLKTHGFNRGTGPNALYAWEGKPNDVMQMKYAPKKGDTVVLIPKSQIINSPNGPKIKSNYKPTNENIIRITEDGQSPLSIKKSQLTEIWNKAHQKTVAEPLANKDIAEQSKSLKTTEEVKDNIASILRLSTDMKTAAIRIQDEIGINIPLEILKKYEVQFKGGATPELTNKIVNDIADQIKLDEIIPRKKQVKTTIAESTGLKQEKAMKSIREDVLLRKRIRDEARGAKEGFKEGAKVTKEQMIEKFKQGEMDRQTVVEYIKENLPLKEQGRFINALKDVDNIKKEFSVFARVDKTKTELEQKELVSEVGELLNKPKGSVAVDYQKQIEGLRLELDLKTPTDKTMYKLKALSDYIKRKGIPLGISPERLASVERLSKIPLKKMSKDDLSELKDNLEMLRKLGKLKLELKNKYNERERALNLNKLIESSRNFDPKKTGNETIDKAKIEIKKKYIETIHTPRVADAIDGYKAYKGENAKYVKRLGAAENRAKIEARNKTIDIIEKIKAIKPDWTEAEQRDVVMLLHYEQNAFDQVETLMQLHNIKELPEKTPEYEKVMDIIRSGLNNSDRIAPIYEEITNKIFKKVDKYFPIKYEKEFNLLPEDMINQERHRTSKTFQGFTKERTKGVQKEPRTDLFKILDETINEQEWYINVQPELENTKYLVKSEEYKAGAGELAADFWANELDVVARRGWSATAKSSFLLRQARLNLNKAVLGFRLSSALLQPFAIFDAIAYTQSRYGTFASAEVLKEFSKTWLNPWYAKKVVSQSPALTLRQGGEIGIEETLASSKAGRIYDKISDLSMFGIRQFDLNTAAGVQRGIQNILERQGVSNAKEEAEFVMNMVSGSSDVAYRPLILSKGEGARTWFTFQTFALNRWGIMIHDFINTGAANKGIKPKMNALIGTGILVGATLAEEIGRRELKKITAPNAKQKPLSLTEEALLTVPSQVPYFGGLLEASMKGYDNDPAVIRTLENTYKGGANILKGKEVDTRIRGAIGLTGGLASLLLGVPGTSQATDILKNLTYNDSNKRQARK